MNTTTVNAAQLMSILHSREPSEFKFSNDLYNTAPNMSARDIVDKAKDSLAEFI